MDLLDASDATPISARIGEYVAGFQPAAVPNPVGERAKLLALDAIGIAFAASKHEYAHRILGALRTFGSGGTGSVIGFRERLPLRDVVVMNAALIHGLDYDDTHVRAIVHPTASALPCALAVCEELDASGATLLAAYVLGVEMAVRIADAAGGNFQKAGYHPTGLVAHFSCALQAGWLYGLSAKQLADAQGIAGSTAAGTQEFLVEGAWNKRLHPGWAAMAGIMAARLAQSGFDAITQPYEGRSGLYKGHLGASLASKVDYTALTGDLGSRWELPNVAIKPYPICHMIHACADSALAIQRTQGLQASRIKRITVRIPEETFHVIAEPMANKTRPQTEYEARFSVQYVVAACLARGQLGRAELEMEAIHDPAILALACRVEVEADKLSTFPKYFSGGVRVEDDIGQIHDVYEPVNRGAGDRALSADDIVAKFAENVEGVLSPERAREVREAILAMERHSARDLAQVLRAR